MDIASGVLYAVLGLEAGTYAIKYFRMSFGPCSDDPCRRSMNMLHLPFPVDIIAQEYHFHKHPKCLDNSGLSCLEEKVTA